MENHLNLSPEDYRVLKDFNKSIEDFRTVCINAAEKFSKDSRNLINKVQSTLRCAEQDIRMLIKSIEDEKAKANK